MRDNLKEFMKYVSLSILGLIGLSCYILADTFFISDKLGSMGIAALNFSIPVYSLISGIGMMIGIGGATRFSILKGQQEEEQGNVVFTHCMTAGTLSGVVLAIIGFLFAKPLAVLLGADITTLDMTKVYISTILGFSPFFIVNNILLAFVRHDYNPKLSMNALMLGSLSNIVLDYIFMYPLKMGMFGAAFATGIAPVVGILLLSRHFITGRNTFSLKKIKFKMQIILDVMRLGLATFIAEISSGVVLITFNLVILKLEGNLGVSSYGIVANIALVCLAIFTGIAQGVQPLLSRSHGSGDKKSIKGVMTMAFITSAVVAALIYASSYIYTDSIVKVFNGENIERVSELARSGIRIYFTGFFFAGINIIIATFMSSTERTRSAFAISLLRGSVLFIPAVLILGSIWNMTGVWLSFVLTELIVMCISLRRLYGLYRAG